MTLAELIEQTADLPRDTPVLVWDFGEGGTVEANDVEFDRDGEHNGAHGVIIEFSRH